MGKIIRLFDIIIALFVVAVGIISLVFILCGKTAQKALVLIDGEVVSELDLSENGEYIYGKITVSVSGGKIAVISSECHDKICQKTGWISKKGQSIVCLPERFVILLEGEAEYDVIL